MRIPAAPLFGRESELREIAAMLAGGVRIVTLVGPPGVGKSRLALHAAGELPAAGATSVAFVALAPVAATDFVLTTIGQALGVADGDGPLTGRIAKAVDASGTTLLLLDNLEHLAGVGAVVAELVAACAGVQVLATSRECLWERGEHAVEVRPLALPRSLDDLAAVAASPAVALFVARAGSGSAAVSRTDLPAVAAICARMDGLPLAIELVAASLPLLGTRGLLEAIETSGSLPPRTSPGGEPGDATGEPRHATLDDAIGWSYRLLSPDAAALFRRLTVFPGGFTRDVAERIASGREAGAPYPYGDGHELVGYDPRHFSVRPDYSPPEAVDRSAREGLAQLGVGGTVGLERLLEANPVQPTTGADGAPRFGLLQTIRAFGLRQLAESGEEEGARHAAAAISLAYVDAANYDLWTFKERSHRWRRLPDELSNIRDALAWATRADRPRAELAQRIAATAWYGLQLLGLVPEARAWLETALSLPGAPPMARGFALNAIAFVAWAQGETVAAEAASTEVIDRLPALVPDPPPSALLGTAHFLRALVAWRNGQVGPMVGDLQVALAHFRVVHDLHGLGNCALAFGVLARVKGDADEARGHFDEAYRLHGEIGYAWGLATSSYYAGETAHDAGDAVEAARLIRQGLDRYWAEGDRWGTGACAAGLAALAAERGEYRRAARLFGGAFAMSEGIGAVLPPLDLDRYRAVAEEEVRPQTGNAPFEEGRRTPPEETVAAARRLVEEIVAGVVPVVRNRLKDLLTPDQYPVVELWVQGKSVDEIMSALSKGKSTVYDHLEGARDRLGVRTNRDLAVRGSELLRQVD